MKLTAKLVYLLTAAIIVVMVVNGILRIRREVELFDRDMRETFGVCLAGGPSIVARGAASAASKPLDSASMRILRPVGRTKLPSALPGGRTRGKAAYLGVNSRQPSCALRAVQKAMARRVATT